MKRPIFLCFVCAMLCGVARSQTGQFIPSDRFSSSLISSICQDREGSLWIGTDYGLNRYDGYSFHTFLHDDADTSSIHTNTVVSMLCDRDGRFWVGTNRGLDLFNPADESFTHYTFPEG